MQRIAPDHLPEYFAHIVERDKHRIVLSVCQCCLRVIAFAPSERKLEPAEIAHFKRCPEIAKAEMYGAY